MKQSKIIYLSEMKLRLTLITFLCLWLTITSAVNLDSLWGVWNDSSQPDTNRLKAMRTIAWDGYILGHFAQDGLILRHFKRGSLRA